MENKGLVLPTLIVGEQNIISIIIQILIFAVVIGVIIYMLKIYFKNVELKGKSGENREEIEENFEKIEKIKKWSVKIGGIIFAIIILATILLGNYF